MRVVIALGGNALLRRGESLSAEAMIRNVERAAEAVAAITQKHEVVITHGNGPQVGLLALQALAYEETPPYPLDVLGAESEGMIGYLLEQALRNVLPGREVVSLLSQVAVSPDDPAFEDPSKPIGPVYTVREAAALHKGRGWTLKPDGEGLRRVVASPAPKEILGAGVISRLVGEGVLVICAGGGGVPVIRTPEGLWQGVEGVIDKDRTAALLARDLKAEALLLLTDVEGVWPEWPARQEAPIERATPAELAKLKLDPGSMGPKAEAACMFVEQTGGYAAIGALHNAAAILAGDSGTRIGI